MMRRAFTLLEVVVAVGVFAIGMVAVIGLFTPVAKSVGDNADAEAAARVADALTLKLKSQPLLVVAGLLKNSKAGGHQLTDADADPNAHPITTDPQIVFASRDGLKIGGYTDPVWIDATTRRNSDREKFFEIALIRNETLSPVGSETDPASPYLAYTARLRWPAFLPDTGTAAIQVGSNPAAAVRFDHSRKQVLFFAGAVNR